MHTMHSKSSLQALKDIEENIWLARQFLEGMDFESFSSDRKTVYAVTRALEIISEAVRRLPPEILDQYPEIPWRDIKAAGNVFRHDYEEVLDERLWVTVQFRLQALSAVVTSELASIDDH